VVPALSQQTTHEVVSGDTLWDLSEKYWQDAELWPELWAMNPQVRNPHWIYPGDLIHLERMLRERGGKRVVRLPLERLAPPAEQANEGSAGSSGAADGAGDDGKDVARRITLGRQESLDFVSSHRLARLGVVENVHQVKVTYGSGEDIEFRVEQGDKIAIGDKLSLFEDETPVLHPVSGVLEGYYVEVLGHLKVLGVEGGRGVGRIIESYQSIEDGAGLMPYRNPLTSVDLRAAQPGLEGVILRGSPQSSIFADDDVVFLDKGSLHGLASGMVLEVPVRAGTRSAQGAVELRLPLATMVVLTTEDKNAAGLIVSSRAALEPGDRFTTAPFSP
jgi:hypothetical protein